mmetsp:Transcript_34266/g.52616  ORF Transcript_34266/g.52616 Transcript_34266/m.52616 type:complete len:84 (-) Transcript_34266:282-533(-)
MQELNTASECIRDVFPGAEIVADRTDNYPIRVVVKAQMGAQSVPVWSGRQQSLFRKYAKERKKAISAIKTNLEDLKTTLDDEE